MPYNPNIPQPQHIIANSQEDILIDFETIQALIAVDHYPFGDPLEGKHKKLTLRTPRGLPDTANNEVAFLSAPFSFLPGGQELQALIFKRQNNAGTVPFGVSLDQKAGWALLPSRILLKWGRANGAGVVPVVYPVDNEIPVFTAVFTTYLTPVFLAGDGGKVVILSFTNYTNLGFEAWCGFRNEINFPTRAIFNYLTIGLR